jgi:roadblock/LC7 domain-containing protein
MAFSLNQLNALEAAMASGQTSVSYDGKRIDYRSVGELVQARNIVRAELIASGQLSASPLSNRGPGSLMTFSRD